MLDMTLDTEVDLDKELRKFRHQELKELTNAVTNSKQEKRTKIRKEEVRFEHYLLNVLVNQCYDCEIQM